MIFARLLHRVSRAAAVLAVALLCVASVKSVVMQADADMMGGVPICSSPFTKTSGQAEKMHKACAFCAAAHHAPTACDTPRLLQPSAVAWAPYRIQTATGPRGPPAFRPTARGPPRPTLTV